MDRYNYIYFLVSISLYISSMFCYLLGINSMLIVKVNLTLYILVTFIYCMIQIPKKIIKLKGLKNDFRLEHTKTDSNRESDRV